RKPDRGDRGGGCRDASGSQTVSSRPRLARVMLLPPRPLVCFPFPRGSPMSQPDISNLANCTEDARLAGLDMDPGPAEPTDFHALRGRLQAVRSRFSPLYQQVAFDPYVATLDDLGESGFNQILIQDPERVSTAGLMLDIAQALLQRGEKFEA